MRKQPVALTLLLIAGLVGGVLLAVPAGGSALAAGFGARDSASFLQGGQTAVPGVPGFITATPAADGSITHEVKSGEFLITIAQAYGISLDELLRLNNLTAESILQVGQKLIIRKATNPLPALTSGTVIAPSRR